MEDITPDDSVVPVYLVPLSEDTLREQEQWALIVAEQEAEQTRKEEVKQSALAKLSKLGLTEEEAHAIIGI